MLELPGTEWRDRPWTEAEVLAQAPQPAEWRHAGTATHGFTHFELRLEVMVARVEVISADGLLHAVERLGEAALPTAMRRCVAIALQKASARLPAVKHSPA